jgi:hypothetical protein
MKVVALVLGLEFKRHMYSRVYPEGFRRDTALFNGLFQEDEVYCD